MGKQTQNAAAARARAARWLANNPEPADTPETSDSEQHSPTAAQHFPICIDSDSDDDDCGYAGVWMSALIQRRNLRAWMRMMSGQIQRVSLSWKGRTGGMLAGTEAKVTEHKPEEVTTPYDEIRGGKSAKAFAKAEKNRGWGIMACRSVRNNCMTRKHETERPCASGHEIRECNW